jgi:RNA polymerase sigma factor (sigma-70 family)
MSAVAAKLEVADELAWSDERLVKECLQGNEQAWSALIDRYKNLIFSIPIKYEFSREDASDIFQTVCVELLSNLRGLRKPRAIAKWLIQTTSHACLHHKHREQRYVAADDLPEAADEAAGARTEQIIREAEEEQILRDSLAELRPRCARLVRMLFFDTPTLPYSEIAKQLGLATGSIGFIRGRCLDHLRKQLLTRGWK